MRVEYRTINAALKYVAAKNNIFRGYHTATALTRCAGASVHQHTRGLEMEMCRVHEEVDDGFIDPDYLDNE